jgi:hypothetical protein
MRLHFGLPRPLDPVARGVEHWHELTGVPRQESAEEIMLGVVAVYALGALVAAVWWGLDDRWLLRSESLTAASWHVALALVATLVLHELIHFALLPRSISGRGFGICLYGAFVAAEGSMSRTRFLVIALTPFVLLTLGPLLWRLLVGPVNELVKYVSIWNGACSIFDLIVSARVVMQVPREATVHMGTGSLRYTTEPAAALGRAGAAMGRRSG